MQSRQKKGELIYRYQKYDSPTAEAHFKGALIYKIVNRTSQNAASLNGSAKKLLFYKMQVGKSNIWIPSSELQGLHRTDTGNPLDHSDKQLL